jgi:hypothetical protein
MGCVFTVAIQLPTSCELFFGPILRGMLRWAVEELRGTHKQTHTQTDIGNDRFRDLHYGVRQMMTNDFRTTSPYGYYGVLWNIKDTKPSFNIQD